MPQYQDMLPAQPEEPLVPGVDAYESDEEYLPVVFQNQPASEPVAKPVQVPVNTPVPPEVMLPPEPVWEAPVAPVPVAAVVPTVPVPQMAPAPVAPVIPVPQVEPVAVVEPIAPAPVTKTPVSAAVSNIRILDIPDQPVQILTAEPVRAEPPPVAPALEPVDAAEPTFKVLPDNSPKTSLELLAVLPKKEVKIPKHHILARPKGRPRPDRDIEKSHTVFHGAVTAVLTLTLLVTGSFLLFGRSQMAEDFHGAAPFYQNITDQANAFISKLVNRERFRWEVTLFDGADQLNGRMRLLPPGRALTITFTDNAVCTVPVMVLMNDEKDGLQVNRAKRGLECPSLLTVETTGKGTTDCTEVSDGTRYEDTDTYTISNDAGHIIGTVKMSCKILE